MMPDAEQRRFKDNLQDEVDGAAVYSALADAEKDENVAKIYRRLAAVERAHAEFWRSRVRPATPLSPGFRARGLGWVAPRLRAGLLVAAPAAAAARCRTPYHAPPHPAGGGGSPP